MPWRVIDLDHSNGYEGIATEYMARRGQSRVGVGTLRAWSRALPRGASVLDLGCGDGVPVTSTLLGEGFAVHALDASPAMVAAFQKRFPEVPVACEPAESSGFFGLRYDGVVAVGLMFLLTPEAQRDVIGKVARSLRPGGHFLFSAPSRRCGWTDVLTGRESVSLGSDAYRDALSDAALEVVGSPVDQGGNHHFCAVKAAGLDRGP